VSAEVKPSTGAFRGLAEVVVIAEAGATDGDGMREFRITRDGTGNARYYVQHDVEVPAELYRDALATARAATLNQLVDEAAAANARRAGRS
jgi:hypothetical protein